MFKANLLKPIKFENSQVHSFEMDYDTLPVVNHCYGYRVEKHHSAGELVYVEHNEAWTHEGIEHEYNAGGTLHWTTSPDSIHGHEFTGNTRSFKTHYRESWTVYLTHGHVVSMNTIAAKQYLRAIRRNGKLVEDVDGIGAAAKERYQFAMSR